MSEDVLTDTAHEDRTTTGSSGAGRSDDASRADSGDGAASGRDSSRLRRAVGRIVVEYAALTAVVAAVVAVMVRPWVGGWSNPITYGNDTLSHLAMLHGAGITGTARGTSSLGAPDGLSWVDFPLGPDRVHLIVFRLVRLAVGDEMLALNLAILAGFFLVAWASFAVLRALRISPLVAGAISVVFTIAPYHFARLSDGHIFLAAYFAVPLGMLLTLWASDRSIHWRAARGRLAVVVGCVLVVGSSSAYYAVFSVVLIASLGLVLALRRGSWRSLLVPFVVSAAIVGVVGANVAGDVWANHSQGMNNEVSVRPASDSATFGLSLAQLVLPDPGHRVAALGQLGHDAAVNRDGGESGSAIGLLALLGLLAIAITCVRAFRRDPAGSPESAPAPPAPPAAPDDPGGRREPLMLRLGVMALAATLVATIGSVSLLVALLGFGQIRVWSRMSIVLAFLGLVGLAVVLDRVMSLPQVRSRQLGPVLVVVGLLAFAVLDQTSPGSLPDRGVLAEDRAVDVAIEQQMAAGLPGGAEVFELPQTDFLFALPSGEMPLYAHLGPWSADPDDLAYSAGGLQGRGSDWQRSWVAQPVDRMLPGLAAAGYDGVYLDRRSEVGDVGTAPAATWLRRTLGAPSGVVPDGDSSREWFDLRPLREELVARLGAGRVDELGAAVRRPIGVVYDGAAERFAVSGGARLLGPDARITLRDDAVDDGSDANAAVGPVRVRFELTGARGSTVVVRAAGVSQDVVLGAGPTPVELELPGGTRDSVIDVHTDAPRLAEAKSRLGDVRVQISQLQVIDAGLDDAVSTGELTIG